MVLTCCVSVKTYQWWHVCQGEWKRVRHSMKVDPNQAFHIRFLHICSSGLRIHGTLGVISFLLRFWWLVVHRSSALRNSNHWPHKIPVQTRLMRIWKLSIGGKTNHLFCDLLSRACDADTQRVYFPIINLISGANGQYLSRHYRHSGFRVMLYVLFVLTLRHA